MPRSTSSIDVIIPVFNGEAFIKQAVLSVIGQTLQPAQIIIVDDGSTDATEQIVQQVTANSPVRITYIYQQNKGVSAARNIGIINSSSDYIAFLDADDTWQSTKLAEQFAIFQSDLLFRTGVVYTDVRPIDFHGNDTEEYFGDFLDKNLRGNIFTKLFKANISSSASGVLVKRECFTTAGLFDLSLSACEDWDMWLRIAEYYEFDYVDQQLVNIRLHKKNASKDIYAMILGRVIVLHKLYERHQNDPLIMQELRYNVIRLIVQSIPSFRALADIQRLLPAETRRKIFANATGIFQAIRKGIYKLLDR